VYFAQKQVQKRVFVPSATLHLCGHTVTP
jgi:hypothetical protein